MASAEVRAQQQSDGTWTVYVRHVAVLPGLTRKEAERRALEPPRRSCEGNAFRVDVAKPACGPRADHGRPADGARQ